MMAPCAKSGNALEQKSIEHSTYIGRTRLGRYVQHSRKKYQAFDANDKALGNLHIRSRTEYGQDYSVYEGRKRLGRVVRLEKQKYLAFDGFDRILVTFRRLKPALLAISMAVEAPQ